MVDPLSRIQNVALAFVDLETTGLSADGRDRVCEVAILRYQGADVVDAFSHLVNPLRPMDPGAERVHGISDEMLAGQPRFDEVADEVLAVLEGAVVVGHNLAFDLAFLRAEFRRLGRRLPEDLVGLCTMRLARSTFPGLPSYALGNLVRSLGVRVAGNAHRAMADVLMTRGVFVRLAEELHRLGLATLHDYCQVQGGALRAPSAAPAGLPPVLERALAAGQRLQILYRSGGGCETERVITPLLVEDHAGGRVLVAFCHLRQARRDFRLDRILSMAVAAKS